MKRGRGGDPDAASIAAAAAAWLAEAAASLGTPATLSAPLTIHGPAGEADGWFVPLLTGEQLIGYLRFGADGSRRGLSSFQRRPGQRAGCPQAADWLDAQRITARARAHAHAGPDATALPPVLSYDGSPEHLAWRVVFTAADGRRCAVCVAGTSAWRCAAAG